jgi:alpha-amylase
MHKERIFSLFGQKPKIFMNTEMIYSDEIGALVAEMGCKGMITEGEKHILGWKSPNFVYANAINPDMKIMMRNFKLSDDISLRFSDKNWLEYPLTAEKFTEWIDNTGEEEKVINIFLNYESFGKHQQKENSILDFLEDFVTLNAEGQVLKFVTPSEIIDELQPDSVINVPAPISWEGEEHDIAAWLGNDMQKEAYEKLYSLADRMEKCNSPELQRDWNYLQASDHFYYMSIGNCSHGSCQNRYNPFNTPYEAFINYMNVLSDFIFRLNSLSPENEIDSLYKMIFEKEKKIKKMENEILRLQKIKK